MKKNFLKLHFFFLAIFTLWTNWAFWQVMFIKPDFRNKMG